jgi:hypothetical protein
MSVLSGQGVVRGQLVGIERKCSVSVFVDFGLKRLLFPSLNDDRRADLAASLYDTED